MKISELYNNLGQRSEEFINLKISIEEEMIPCYDYKRIDQVIRIVYDKEKGALRDSSLLKKVYIIGGNNPGCDIVIFHKDLEGKKIIPITINTKYSQTKAIQEINSNNSQTKKEPIQEIDEIKENSILTFEQFPEDERKNVYFVAVCWRKGRKYSKIPENIIILTKEDLKQLYSSLNERPQLNFNI